MADAPELNFGQLLQSDPEYMDMMHRKAMAEALLKNTMAAQPGANAKFKRNPVAVLADFMAMKGQRDKIQSVSAEERALLTRHKEAEAAGVREFLDAVSAPNGDRKAAVLKAMSSQYPNLKKLGESLYKGDQENFGKIVAAMPHKIDPQSAINAGGNPSALRVAPPLPPPQLMSGRDPTTGESVPWIQDQKPDGGYGVHTIPKGTTVTNNLGPKTGYEVLEQQGKYYAAGGKGFELGQKIQTQLQNSGELLRALEVTPALGAGGEAFQLFRKWSEVISPGISNGLAGNADQVKSQLAEKVIKELGGLGNQVSDRDVKIMQAAVGSLETDPNALRRITMIGMKYQMKALAALEEQQKRIAQSPAFRDLGLQFPGYTFSQNVPEKFAPEFNQYMDTGVLPMPPVLNPGASRVRPRQ